MKRIWDGLLYFQKGIMIITSFGVAVIMFMSVILRYIFKTDLYGLEELICIFASWLYFMGSSYGSYQRSQISADILSSYITNKKIRQASIIFTSFVSTSICLIVTYWSLMFFVWAIVMDPRSPVYRIPMAVSQCSVFVGFCLMSLYSIVHLINDFKAYMEIKNSGNTNTTKLIYSKK